MAAPKSETDIKKEKQQLEIEEREKREKQREREKRHQRSNEVRPPPTGPDGTLPQYLATMGSKIDLGTGDRKREVSRSPVRSIASASPGARSNTSSVAPTDVRSVESASVSPLVKRETGIASDTRPLSASHNHKDKGSIGSLSGNSDTSHQNNTASRHHSSSGLSSRSTSANDLASAVKKEEANEITVIGEKEGMLNGRPSRSSLNNHSGLGRDHSHTTSLHGGHRKTDSPSRQHSSASSLRPSSAGLKPESRGPVINSTRDTHSVKPPSISQSTSMAAAISASRASSELHLMQQQAAAVSIASSLSSGMPYPSIPGLLPPGYPASDPRTAAALGLFPGLNHRPGAATPLPPAGGFGAPGMFRPGLDPFRDHYLAAAAMGAAASNPYMKDPIREAREREMLRMNPLGSMIMSEHDRARMALGYHPGMFPPSVASPTASGIYGMSAAALQHAASAAGKIPPPLGTPGAGTALGGPHLGMYAGFPSHSALAALGASGAGVPGLTPPLTPTVNGHGGPSSTSASPALSRDPHPLAR